MKNKITEERRIAILEKAWEIMAQPGGLHVGMTELARAAEVSRQTLFYGFGNRAGLLVAMARHQDTRHPAVTTLGELARGNGNDLATLQAYADAWLSYLPTIYPVAFQLEMASLTDPDARTAFQDRIQVGGLRTGLDLILARMSAAGNIHCKHSPEVLADLSLSLLLPSAWRLLVVERGWTPEAFAESRRTLLRSIISAP